MGKRKIAGELRMSCPDTNVYVCVYLLFTLPHTHEHKYSKIRKVFAHFYFKYFKLGETHYSITIGYTPIYDSCK